MSVSLKKKILQSHKLFHINYIPNTEKHSNPYYFLWEKAPELLKNLHMLKEPSLLCDQNDIVTIHFLTADNLEFDRIRVDKKFIDRVDLWIFKSTIDQNIDVIFDDITEEITEGMLRQ